MPGARARRGRRTRGRPRSACRSAPDARARPATRRSSVKAGLASIGDVGAPCGRCGVASRRPRRAWAWRGPGAMGPMPAHASAATTLVVRAGERVGDGLGVPAVRRTPNTRAGGQRGEEVLHVEAQHHRRGRRARPRACAPTARRTKPCAAGWAGIQSRISCRILALDGLQPRLGLLEQGARARRAARSTRSGSCARGRRRRGVPSPGRRPARRGSPSARPSRAPRSATVSSRGTGHGARPIAPAGRWMRHTRGSGAPGRSVSRRSSAMNAARARGASCSGRGKATSVRRTRPVSPRRRRLQGLRGRAGASPSRSTRRAGTRRPGRGRRRRWPAPISAAAMWRTRGCA